MNNKIKVSHRRSIVMEEKAKMSLETEDTSMFIASAK